jgi:hypothetical protein
MNDGRNEESINNLNNILRRAQQVGIGGNENILDNTNPFTLLSTFKREFKKVIYSNKCFSISALIISVLLGFFFYTVKSKRFEIESLESEEMVFIYFLAYLTITIITWNFYLFICLVVSQLEHNKIKTFSVLTADILYFNPFLFTFMIYYYNKSFLLTTVDIFAWLLVASHYFINFCFTVNLSKHASLKISQITNFALPENQILIAKIRLNYFMLIGCNFLFSAFVKWVIYDTDFMYKYFILLKVMFLFT